MEISGTQPRLPITNEVEVICLEDSSSEDEVIEVDEEEMKRSMKSSFRNKKLSSSAEDMLLRRLSQSHIDDGVAEANTPPSSRLNNNVSFCTLDDNGGTPKTDESLTGLFLRGGHPKHSLRRNKEIAPVPLPCALSSPNVADTSNESVPAAGTSVHDKAKAVAPREGLGVTTTNQEGEDVQVVDKGKTAKQRALEEARAAKKLAAEQARLDKQRIAEQAKLDKRRIAEQARLDKRRTAEQARLEKRQCTEAARMERGAHALHQISVLVDSRLAETPVALQLVDMLEEHQMLHRRARLQVPCTVEWRRHPPKRPDASSTGPTDIACTVPYVLLLMDAEKFDGLIDKNCCELAREIEQLQQVHSKATLCLMVLGLQRHLRACARPRRVACKEAVAWLCTHSSGVRHWLPVNEFEAAQHIFGLTKSLAKLPYWPEENYLSVFGHTSMQRIRSLTADVETAELDDSEGVEEASQACAPDDIDQAQEADVPRIGPSGRQRKIPSPKEIWLRALLKVSGCAEADARAIVKAYPSMAALCNAYADPLLSPGQAEGLLKDLIRDPGSSTALGASTQRRLGPILSARMFKLFSISAEGETPLL